MTKIFKWLFVESSARWLIYILTAEYFIATNLSPTILTDYPILNSLVESMAFIPAVHNFDKIATHPEAVRFYIALAIFLIIPKSMSIYHWLRKNPIKELRQYVISPLTNTQPASTHQVATDSWMTEEQIKQQPTKKRSMASRIFWSLMILLFTFGCSYIIYILGYGGSQPYMQEVEKNIAVGGLVIWFQLSLKMTTFIGLLIAISAFVIKDYLTYFKSFF